MQLNILFFKVSSTWVPVYSIPSFEGKRMGAGISINGSNSPPLPNDQINEYTAVKSAKININLSGECVLFDSYTIYSRDIAAKNIHAYLLLTPMT
ncbi:hypothetical protein GC096_32675 [Paenibacillus sp. LMG 31461]|uniref:Uncharacterized protein n=1 Tax=Paenibacillus plantarum TaxID=2654975 RepID=A0ABX1XL78_9BACL|nr:hypothetical protein [Paenibacillus plantarum]NOU68781.1 hypothetical protein [Paenibacillus plantarum]